ncbi:MAG: GldG family protein [Treponema sp.]|nr:GldG family protein [Treponema sp.]
MTRKQTAALTVLSLVALALAFLVSRRFWFRLDFTRNRAYTISAVSRNLHTEIPDQVRITYYLSDKLRSMHPMPGEIEDLLREYAAYSRGKIRLVVRDPVKARLAEQVERLGIQPQQIQTVAEDQSSLVTVYTGLAIEYLDAIEVLPVVFSLDTLEYDLTSRIRALVRGSERQIGIIAGDRRWNEDYVYLNQAFAGAGYRPYLIAPGDEIPDSLPALFVLGGAEALDGRALYRIDRYIRLGGRALFALDGIYVDALGSFEARRPNDQGLLEMVASYGVSVRPELVLDRAALTLQYRTGSPGGGGVQYRIIRYPHWIAVLPESGNLEHPVSAHFGGLDLFWASPLELHAPEGVEAVPLFTSTGDAWVMRDRFYTNPEDAGLFEREAAQTRGLKILGASLTGTFPSWFSGAPKPAGEGSEEELPDMPARPRPSRIIVVGDTDFATALIGVSGGGQNLDFLLQAADWLGNDDDIIGIRSRESGAGRLDRIIDPEKRIAAMRLVQLVNVILTPLFVVFAGLLFAWRRRARFRLSAKEHFDDV